MMSGHSTCELIHRRYMNVASLKAIVEHAVAVQAISLSILGYSSYYPGWRKKIASVTGEDSFVSCCRQSTWVMAEKRSADQFMSTEIQGAGQG